MKLQVNQGIPIEALKAFSMAHHRLAAGKMAHLGHSVLLWCLKVSNVSFDFPEIEISSMVKQTSLHANCFSGVSFTFKVV